MSIIIEFVVIPFIVGAALVVLGCILNRKLKRSSDFYPPEDLVVMGCWYFGAIICFVAIGFLIMGLQQGII